MSFLDELKNAPSQQMEKEKVQMLQDRELLVETFVTYLKDVCRYIAQVGETRGVINVQGFIEYMDEEYTQKYSDYDSDTVTEIVFQNTEQGAMWMRMRNKFYHYICEEKEAFKHPYPTQMGMSKQDATWLSDEAKSKLVEENLTVNTRLLKAYWKVHYEDKFVQHKSSFEKMLAGSNGHYKEVEVMDEQMYLFDLDVSW